MRNLADYQTQYRNQPYEAHQAEFRRRMVLKALRQNRARRILEIGCGLNPLFCDYSTFSKMTVLEPAAGFYRGAVSALRRSGLSKKVSIHALGLERASEILKSESFDFIVLSSLLHELEDAASALKTIHKLSSPETLIHINVPNADSFHRVLAVRLGLIKHRFETSASQKKFQQKRIFTEGSLRRLVQQNGFRVIKAGDYAFKPFTHAQMQMLIDRRVLDQEVLEVIAGLNETFPGMGSEIFVDLKKR